MKRLIYYSGLVLLFTTVSCTRDLTSLNRDPKNPSDVPAKALFTNAQRSLGQQLATSDVNYNIFRLIEQHWQETTYTDESNYDLISRTIPDFIWNVMYRDVLKDFTEAQGLIPRDVNVDAIRKNQLAITDIMEVFTYYYLVTTFGNVPYSEALSLEDQFPKFDDANTIYADLLNRINNDIASLDPSEESFGGADLLYNGDVNEWLKFANSFKMKLGLLIADSDPALAKSTIESAVAAGIMESNLDNATMFFLTAPPNANPIWVDQVQSGRQDFVGASTLIDHLKTLNDPRLGLYYTRDAVGGYSGGEPGASSNYATFSKPSTRLFQSDAPYTFFDYSEVEFMLAEAVERGINVPGTAEEHYSNAIRASITQWGGSDADADTYLALPDVAYATAAGDWKEKIGGQKWIALFNRGWDAWIETRRLDFPQLVAPASAVSDFPQRFTYPINEQNINKTNYDQASSAIGGDVVDTKLWWDKF